MPFLERTVRPLAQRIYDAGKAPILEEGASPSDPSEPVNSKETLGGLLSALLEMLLRHVELLPSAVGTLLSAVRGCVQARWAAQLTTKVRAHAPHKQSHSIRTQRQVHSNAHAHMQVNLSDPLYF